MTGLEDRTAQPPAPPAPVPAVGEQPTTRLVADIADDAGTLITQHVHLFAAEMRDGLGQAKWWALAAATGTLFLVVGTLFVFISAVHGLQSATKWDEWVCWLVIGGSLLVLGGVLAAVGGKYLFSVSLVPNRTIKSLSETWSWLVKRSK